MTCADSSTDTITERKIKIFLLFMSHVSYVMCHVSHIRCQVSGVACRVSPVTCHYRQQPRPRCLLVEEGALTVWDFTSLKPYWHFIVYINCCHLLQQLIFPNTVPDCSKYSLHTEMGLTTTIARVVYKVGEATLFQWL